jgi:hypothetical protein
MRFISENSWEKRDLAHGFEIWVNKMLHPLIRGFCAVALLFAPTYSDGSRKATMRPFSGPLYIILGSIITT